MIFNKRMSGVLGRALAVAGVVCSAAVGCTSGATGTGDHHDAGGDRPVVVASFYPIQWLAGELVGDQADVISLTPEGTEPHDLALTADSQKDLNRASVVLYLGADFQPDVQRAVGQLPTSVAREDLLGAPGVRLRDAATGSGEHALAGNKDPHVWLSPAEMLAMADATADVITTAEPQLRQQVSTALPKLQQELKDLDAQYRNGLADCASKVLVTSHAAFGYLADAYGLEQVPIAGVTPEDEPDPRTLQSIAQVAKDRNVHTVFFEDSLPPSLSQAVADEIGARVDLLSALEFDPRGSLGPDQNYITVMQGNLNRIEKGLGCPAS